MIQASIDIIGQHIKEAMKKKAVAEVSVLRMLLAGLKNKKIALGNKEDLSPANATAVVVSEIKKRKDSIEAYEKANRKDLAEKEQAEIKILAKYLPEQISDEEIEEKVKNIISKLEVSDSSDFGKVMGQTMSELKGRVDGAKVRAIVKKILK